MHVAWRHGSGLPQKAGFPQEKICEVHGSWFDPSNPVVKYSGSLQGHLYSAMASDALDADLVRRSLCPAAAEASSANYANAAPQYQC